MSERAIRYSLIWALIGIFILLLVSEFYEPNLISVVGVAENSGKIVKVRGILEKANYYDTVNIFRLVDNTGSIKVVTFEKPDRILKQGDFVEIKGKVTVYKGELEIIADVISCLRCKDVL